MNEEQRYLRSKKWIISALIAFFILVAVIIGVLVSVFDLKNEVINYLSLFNYQDLLVLLFFGLIIYVVDAFRFVIFSRLFFHDLSFKKAVDCVFANFFFSWITPGASMGAPASAFILHLDGLSLSRSMGICLFKGMSGICIFIISALVLSSLNPNLFEYTYLLNVTLAVYLALMTVPLFFRKTFKDLKMRGGSFLLFSLFYHFVFLSVFLLPGVYIYNKFDPNLLSAFVKNFLFFIFSVVSPTPGGLGISEAASLYFYKEMIGVKAAIFVAIAFRFFTFYLQILIGAIYLLLGRHKDLINFISTKLFKA